MSYGTPSLTHRLHWLLVGTLDIYTDSRTVKVVGNVGYEIVF
jgi:hypothetical protein